MNCVRFNLIAVFFLFLFLVNVNSETYTMTFSYNENALLPFKETGFGSGTAFLLNSSMGSGVNKFSEGDIWIINVKIFPDSQITGIPLLSLPNAWTYTFLPDNQISRTLSSNLAA